MNLESVEKKIEAIEQRIEDFKWFVSRTLFYTKTYTSKSIQAIRRSAGILNGDAPRGVAYERKIRKEWKNSSLKRIS